MNLDISTVATIGKSLSVKLEKMPDDTECVMAHLKFSHAFIQRHEIDQLLDQQVGWSAQSFFNTEGAPIGRFTIDAPAIEGMVHGVIRGTNESQIIKLSQALLTDVAVSLYLNGGMLSGSLTWMVAGDEASDIEPLLGKECMLVWSVVNGSQGDLFKPTEQRAAA